MTGNSTTGLTSASTAAVVSGTPVQALSGHTRRGVFGTGSQAHGTNAPFLRLDTDEVFAYAFDPSLIGETLHFKFTSFNLLKQMEEGLGDVTDYTFLLTGKFGNSHREVGNNLTINSLDAGTSVTVQIYHGTIETAGLLYPEGKLAIAVPAASLTGYAYQTVYLVNYNPNANGYVLYTDPVLQAKDQAFGMIGIGEVSTVAVGATGIPGGGVANVIITPESASMFAGDMLQFSAVVTRSSNQAANWEVSGGVGGNPAVGTIDTTGYYRSPSTSGPRSNIAQSVALGISMTVPITVH